MNNPQKTQRSQWILALASGLLLTLAFPKPGQGWLAWIALVPLLLSLRNASPRTGLGLGFAFGLVNHVGLIYWTVHAMHVYGYVPMAQSISVLLLFAAALAAFNAIFGGLMALLCRRARHLIWLAPAIWVGLEFVRTWILTGFPWALLGYSQYKYLWLIQFADLFGVYGVSALVVFGNTVVVLALLFWVEKPWHKNSVSRPLLVRTCTALVAIVIGVLAYGLYRIHATDQATAAAPKTTLAVIQGNIDQAHKWDPSFQVLTTVKYKNMSLAAAKSGADLIIWPETATPFYLFEDKLLTSMVLEGIKAGQAGYVIGSPSVDRKNKPNKAANFYHNSAFLITPQGDIAGKYDKVHLVPFGEYVPFKRVLFFIDKLVAQVGDFKAGERGRHMAWDRFRIGTLICYEGIFPSLSRAMVQNDANLLVIITNDAWFGRTSAPLQHLSMAVFRAVETHRFLARAANTGISGFIDAGGRLMGTTALFEETSLSAQVALLEGRTSYSRWGDWPLALVCFLIPAAMAIHRRWFQHQP